MKFAIGMATDPGQKRGGANQDCIGMVRPGWFNRRPVLLALADGMGGYQGGEIASRLVVDSFCRRYRSLGAPRGYLPVLRDCLAQAHRSVVQAANRRKEIASLGSTVAAAVLDRQDISLLTVGDSRVYHLHGEMLRQVSKDQSVVAELARNGEITAEEIAGHPKRNALTMSISAAREEVQPWTGSVTLAAGDALLLCSDGLWSVVPEEEILYYLLNFPPQQGADGLVAQANHYGGPDNISVIIARSDSVGVWEDTKQ